MAAQDDRFNVKQINTPDYVFCLSDDGHSGQTIGIRLGSRVYGEHASHEIFVDLNAKGVGDLLRGADTIELRIAVLHLDMAAMSCSDGPFGSRFRLRHEEENSR
jgi:hypothetical protein